MSRTSTLSTLNKYLVIHKLNQDLKQLDNMTPNRHNIYIKGAGGKWVLTPSSSGECKTSDTAPKKNLIKKNLICSEEKSSGKQKSNKSKKKSKMSNTVKNTQCNAACWAPGGGEFTQCKAQSASSDTDYCKTHDKVIDKIIYRSQIGHFFCHQKFEINGVFGQNFTCLPCIKTQHGEGNVGTGDFHICDEPVTIGGGQVSSEIPEGFRPWQYPLPEAAEGTYHHKKTGLKFKKAIKNYMKDYRQLYKPEVIFTEDMLAEIASQPQVPEVPENPELIDELPVADCIPVAEIQEIREILGEMIDAVEDGVKLSYETAAKRPKRIVIKKKRPKKKKLKLKIKKR